jgi:UDP-GlcNAc3NAcA epimerase
MPVVLPLHPRTKKAIEQFNLSHYLVFENIHVCEPLGYMDTQALIMYAKMVITDSGGVTKECYYHKVPGILTDKQTEWVETVQEGWNIQAGPNATKIIDAYKNFKLPLTQNNVLGKGDAASKTAIKLNELLSETLKENSFN